MTRLTVRQLEQGQQLWEQAKQATDVDALEPLAEWARECDCGEASLVLAKALLAVALNRIVSSVKDTHSQVATLSLETRVQMQTTLELQAMRLMNEALAEATHGAAELKSLQCFHLACQLAWAVRGRCIPPHFMVRQPLLMILHALGQRWSAEHKAGKQPWADPGAERIIGEQAPFETDELHAAGWAPRALAVAVARLEVAMQDEEACWKHCRQHDRLPDFRPDPRTPIASMSGPGVPFLARIPQLDALVPERQRMELATFLAIGDLNLQRSGSAAVAQRLMQHQQQQTMKLRQQWQQRQQQEATTAAAAGEGGAAAQGPTQDQVQRFLERRLQEGAAAAAAAGSKAARRGKKVAEGAVQAPAVAAAVQSLVRAPAEEVGRAAAEQAPPGQLSQLSLRMLRDPFREKAGGKRSSSGSSSSDGRAYRFPPAAWLPWSVGGEAAAAGGTAATVEEIFEFGSRQELTRQLEGSYVGEAKEAQDAAQHAVEALLQRLPGLRQLLEALPRSSGQQVLHGSRIPEPACTLPHLDSLQLAEGLPADMAFLKLVLKPGAVPSAADLLEVVRACAPPTATELGTPAPGGGGAAPGGPSRRTALDTHAVKTAQLWLPAAGAAVPAAAVAALGADASLVHHVAAAGKSLPLDQPAVESALSRMLLGEAMLRVLERRQQDSTNWAKEQTVEALLRRPLLPGPKAVLQALAEDSLWVERNHVVHLSSAIDTLVPLATAPGAERPALVQLCATLLLAAALARQRPGDRFNLDEVNAERKVLARQAMVGLSQLQRRGRLPRTAVSAICEFINKCGSAGVGGGGGAASSKAAHSLDIAMRRLGGLPLAALAQLAAFVLLLVGRGFGSLADLYPDAFEEESAGGGPVAEVVDGELQLTEQGLAEVLGGDSAALRSACANGGSGSGEGLPAGGVAHLAQRAVQRLARCAAGGSADAQAAQQAQQLDGAAGGSWRELLEALQQQAFLTSLLLRLRAALEARAPSPQQDTATVRSFVDSLALPAGQACKAPELQKMLGEVQESLHEVLQALALAELAFNGLESRAHAADAEQAQASDDSLARWQHRADRGLEGTLLGAAREQLHSQRESALKASAAAEKLAQEAARRAGDKSARQVRERLKGVLPPLEDFMGQGTSSSSSSRPYAERAKRARVALIQLGNTLDAVSKEATAATSTLWGLLDACHLRTQLLLSELLTRCRVHPPSELMGVALRAVLPLRWQQEWRDAEARSSDAVAAELLAEEEQEKQAEARKAAKAAKKKGQAKKGSAAGGDRPADAPAPAAAAAANGDGLDAAGQQEAADLAVGEAGSLAAQEDLPESWEGLPQSAAEAAAAAESGTPLPPGYRLMLQQQEQADKEEAQRRQAEVEQEARRQRREEQRRQQEEQRREQQDRQRQREEQRQEQQEQQRQLEGPRRQEAASVDSDGDGSEAMEARGQQKTKKSGRKRMRERRREREVAAAAAAAAAALQQQQAEAEGPGWQAVAKKGQPRWAAAAQVPPPTPGLPPPPAAGQQRQEQQQLQQQPQALQRQQQPSERQGRQSSMVLVVPRPSMPSDMQSAQEQGKQPRSQQQQQQRQQQQESQPLPPAGSAAGREPEAARPQQQRPQQQAVSPAGSAAGGEREAAQQGGQLWQDMQRLRLQPDSAATHAPPADHTVLSPGRRLSADAPAFKPGTERLQARTSQSQLHLPAAWLDETAARRLGAAPALEAALPQPLSPPLPQHGGGAAADETADLLALMGVGDGSGGAPSPPPAASQPSQPPRLPPGFGLTAPLPTAPASGGQPGMSAEPPSLFAGLGTQPLQQPVQQPFPGSSGLLSAPLPHQQPQRGHEQPVLSMAGVLAPPPVDPSTLAAAAAAARLAGFARQAAPPVPPSLHPHFPHSPHPLHAQQLAGQPGMAAWGSAPPAPAPAAAPAHDDELDSLLSQMLGRSEPSSSTVDAWGSPSKPATAHTAAAGSSSSESFLAQQQQQEQGAGPAPGFPGAAPPPSFLGALVPQLVAPRQHSTHRQVPAQQQQQLAAQDLALQQQHVAAAEQLSLAGLRNERGEYNCFLNVIIQCLWRCADFRQQVLAWRADVTSRNAVARALHHLFGALQHAEAGGAGAAPVPVNPGELREALAALPNQLFQLGEMSDAGETLLSMFEQIREASPGAAAGLDAMFGLKVHEAVHCDACSKVTHQSSYTQYFYNTRASALRRVIAAAAEERRRGIISSKTLGGRLRKIEEAVHKSCDTDHGGCNKSVPVRTRLETAPRVFALQVAWASNNESPAGIADTLAALDEGMDLAELYPGARAQRYRLRSMVCYYGQHYQALVLVPDAGGWLVFDDTRVSRVGAWADVRRKCEAGRIQPSVLFYEAAAT